MAGPMSNKFTLSLHEANSDVWRKIAAFIENEINSAHLRLEKARPDGETNLERGRIMAYRSILRLGVSRPD